MSGDADEALLRQIVADIAAIKESGKGRDSFVRAIARDAREARDGVKALQVAVQEQDWGAKLAAMDARINAVDERARSDLVNAATRARNDIDALSARLKPFEAAAQKAAGMGLLVRVLRDYGGWAVAGLALLVALFGPA